MMHNPPHPGSILREDVLPELGITVTAAAAELGLTRAALSRVLNEKAAISIMLARKLEAWLGEGPSAESWLRMQIVHDLWQSAANEPVSVTPRTRTARR